MYSVLPNSTRRAIDFDVVKNIVAVPNNTAFSQMTDKYALFNTENILDRFAARGFEPTAAFYQNARGGTKNVRGGMEVRKHCVRLALSEDINSAEDCPEIVLVNSHNGTSALKMFAGYFRLVCENGCVIASENWGKVTVKHMGHTIDDVMNIAENLITNFGRIREIREETGAITLNKSEWDEYSNRMDILRANYDLPVIPRGEALHPRRYEDFDKYDLWTVYNIAQENIMRGGQPIYKTDYKARKSRTRAITEIGKATEINEAVWNATVDFAHEIR